MNTIGKKLSKLASSHNLMMAVCCIAMVGAFFVFAGSNIQSSLFSLALPLAACVGMHFVMHKMMGKNCHGTDQKKAKPGKSPLPDTGTVKSLPDSAQ